MKLSVLGKPFHAKACSSSSRCRDEGIYQHGLEIRHTQNSYPSRIIFWTFNPSALKAGLERLGWTVS